jgi:serine/threonine-protein kinase
MPSVDFFSKPYLGSHDQIPRLFAHFEQDSELYLVQEFIEGQTLDCEIASSKQWNQAEIIQFLQEGATFI